MKRFILPLLILLFVGSLFAVESAPSEVVGYVKYDCLAGLNFVALPMEAGYTMASEFADAHPGIMTSMSYWDAATQSWVSADDFGYWEGDFPVQPGMPLMVYASAGSLYSLGDMPTNPATYNLAADLNAIMIPLNRSDLLMAGDAGTEIGTVTSISYWDAATQSWVSADDFGYWEGDFPVSIAMPLMVFSSGSTTWPSRSSISNVNSRNSK